MGKTVASDFYADPRIQQAKELLKSVVADHSKKITGVKAADPELKKSFDEQLKEFGQNRGGALYYPYLGSGIGNGALVELEDGSVKYDFITGIGVHYFGHSHPTVIGAQVEAAVANTTMNGHLQQNSDSAKLVKFLLQQANKNGAQLAHCFLTSSGAMANENALKICFQKRAPANRVLAFSKNFSGRTLAIAQITDKAAYRQGLPDTLKVDYLPFYCEGNHENSIETTTKILQELIYRYPGQHSCMIIEPIQGEAGSWVGNKEFFAKICEILKKNNISIFVDEVQTFGRTSELFAFQYFGLDQYADVVTIGKMSQVCATLFKEDHKPKPGLISQTFTSSSSAIRSGYAILSEMVENGYLGENGKINKMGNYFRNKLQELNKKYPGKIDGPYGVGAMIAMTLFKGDEEKNKKFTFKFYENGVLSFSAGGNPTRIRMLMPVGAVTEKDIDNVTAILEKTINEIE
jgi:acetylornithine aminotransferase